MREPQLDIESNILGTLHVAAGRGPGGVRRLVAYSSGGAIFGEPTTLPVADDDARAPTSVYGVSKLAGDLLVPLLVEGSDLEASIVRPGNVYGPWQDPHGEAGVIAIFAMRMLANQDATIFGDGTQFRDYVFVDDVVEATVRAATETPPPASSPPASAPPPARSSTLWRATGYERPPVMAPDRPGDIHGITLDASRAREAGLGARDHLRRRRSPHRRVVPHPPRLRTPRGLPLRHPQHRVPARPDRRHLAVRQLQDPLH